MKWAIYYLMAAAFDLQGNRDASRDEVEREVEELPDDLQLVMTHARNRFPKAISIIAERSLQEGSTAQS